MSNEYREPSEPKPAEAIVIESAASPWRISKEQLAAAERAKLYHVNKLAACRTEDLPPADPRWAAAATPSDAAADTSAGAH